MLLASSFITTDSSTGVTAARPLNLLPYVLSRLTTGKSSKRKTRIYTTYTSQRMPNRYNTAHVTAGKASASPPYTANTRINLFTLPDQIYHNSDQRKNRAQQGKYRYTVGHFVVQPKTGSGSGSNYAQHLKSQPGIFYIAFKKL